MVIIVINMVSYKIRYCDSLISKAIGFMFSFNPEEVLVFRFKKEKRRSLHMFFVFFNINVIFLDKDKKMVEKTRLKPFSVYTSRKKVMYIIEMPEGCDKKVLKDIRL